MKQVIKDNLSRAHTTAVVVVWAHPVWRGLLCGRRHCAGQRRGGSWAKEKWWWGESVLLVCWWRHSIGVGVPIAIAVVVVVVPCRPTRPTSSGLQVRWWCWGVVVVVCSCCWSWEWYPQVAPLSRLGVQTRPNGPCAPAGYINLCFS
jgi:hypothetical protein